MTLRSRAGEPAAGDPSAGGGRSRAGHERSSWRPVRGPAQRRSSSPSPPCGKGATSAIANKTIIPAMTSRFGTENGMKHQLKYVVGEAIRLPPSRLWYKCRLFEWISLGPHGPFDPGLPTLDECVALRLDREAEELGVLSFIDHSLIGGHWAFR